MARFAIINDLPYQGVPNNRDDLLSDYMLFVCDFDGMNVDTLVAAMIDANRRRGGGSIWQHCVAYPGLGSKDALTAYFERCQLRTNLFLADRPDDAVADILHALVCKREFTNFVKDYQARSVGEKKAGFEAMWEEFNSKESSHLIREACEWV